MTNAKRSCCVTLLLFVSTLPVWAEEAVLLKSGGVLLGKVISMTDDTLAMKIRDGDKSIRKEVSASDVEPTSLYDLKLRRVDAKDAKARLALAEWCMTQGITYFAIQEYEKASSLDPSLSAKAQAGLKRARLARGKAFYEKAVAAMKANRFSEAERLFKILVKHHSTPFGGPAKSALKHIQQARLTATNLRLAGQPSAKEQTPFPRNTSKELNESSRQIHQWTQAGYQSRTDSRARRSLIRASEWTDRALKLIDRMLTDQKIDRASHERLRRKFVRAGADQAIQIAVIYLRQDNEYGANKWLARALTLDPDNERAKELRLFVITEWRDDYPWSVLGRRQR